MISNVQFKLPSLLACCCMALALPARADLVVPVNSVFTMASGSVDFGCGDINVAGTLNLNTGKITNVRSLTIQSGGKINGDAGQIELSGNWVNNSGGSAGFVGGSSIVSFVDNPACATSSTLIGDTVFANLNLVTNVGKNFLFTAGSTQTVTGQLTLLGTPANALVLNSTALNQYAIIDVRGTSRVVELSANWMAATGSWLGIGSVNRNPSGVTQRLFGNGGAVQEVPTLSTWSLLLLMLMMVATSMKTMRNKNRGVSRKNNANTLIDWK